MVRCKAPGPPAGRPVDAGGARSSINRDQCRRRICAAHERNGRRISRRSHGQVASYESEKKAAIRRLVRRMKGDITLMTAEIWSLASVAKFIAEEWRAERWAMDSHDPEMDFLQILPGIVERLCGRLYIAPNSIMAATRVRPWKQASEATRKIIEIASRTDDQAMHMAFGEAIVKIPRHLIPAATDALRKIAMKRRRRSNRKKNRRATHARRLRR